MKDKFHNLWKSNRILQCSLQSIRFIKYFKNNDIQKAIDLLHSFPLSDAQQSMDEQNPSLIESSNGHES